MYSFSLRVCALVAFAALAGCSTLPGAGPLVSDIESQARTDQNQPDVAAYEIIDVDAAVASVLRGRPQESFFGRFGDYRASADLRIGVGDSVTVTIWEAASGGLFSSANLPGLAGTGSKSVTIPEQLVSRAGTITVPYAGAIDVVGRTTQDVQAAVVARLAGKAIEPQALVTVSRNLSNTVTVLGEVTGGGRVPLTLKGDRILDVIAQSGGVRAPLHDTFARLSRGPVTVTVPLQRVSFEPRENIFMRPGDVVTLLRDPQSFTALGATGRNFEINFDAVGISLVEAVAKSGGLNDQRADPEGVYIFRFEPSSLVKAIRPESRLAQQRDRLVPVVYRVNLRDAASFFIAQNFAVRNKDILYVANAPATELLKFLSIIATLTAPVSTGVGIASVTR